MTRGGGWPRRRRILAVAAAVAAGLWIALGVDIVRSGGLDAWREARQPAAPWQGPPVPPYEARGRLVEVDGRRIYIDCRGNGSPTVILENGFGGGAAGWGAPLDGIAAFTRVCAWDRPGIGQSDPRERHGAADVAADLRAALTEAGERGPYIVVAHSFGGVYARVFGEGPGATGDVISYLFLDTYDPDLGMVDDPAIPAAVRDRIRASLADTAGMLAAGENLDWAVVLADLAVAGPADLTTIRLTVDPRSRWVGATPAETELLIAAWERAVARTFPQSRNEVAANSGHLVHFDRPDLVIEAARELVELARAGAPAPS